MPRVAAAIAAAAVLAAPATAAAQGAACSHTTVTAAVAGEATPRDAVRCLVNATRAQHRLPALDESGRISSAADRHGADMVQRRYFGHVSPGGHDLTDRVRRTGYLAGAGHWVLGEDIGWGTAQLGTPAAIVQSWLSSPSHRAIILSRRFHEVGVGIARGVPVNGMGGEAGATYVLDAGRAQ